MSRRNNSANKRTAKPPRVTRSKQSFDDQLRRISDEKEDNSLIIPFSLLVIASYLNRLHFKEIINERLRWDPTQWKYSPGVLAQIMVLSVFVPSRKKVALSRIHEAFAGIDLSYLVGESIDPESLNDDLFGRLLDRMYEYGCSTLYRSISLTVRTIFDLPLNYILHSDNTSHAYLEDKWEHLGICCQYPSGKKSEPEYWSRTYQKDVCGHPMWVHVYRKKEAEQHLERYLNEERTKFETDLETLTSKEFMCEPDARIECEAFLKIHKKSIFSAELSLGSTTKEKRPVGRPSKVPKPSVIETTWSFSKGEIRGDEMKIERKRRKIDSFCLLTSIPPEEMNSREVLLNYKGQNVVESMFSVLKEPLLASTLFLEKPERIEALMTILYFSVLMHGILQLITRNSIERCPKVLKIGPENRPLIRPKAGTVLNILENFEIITVDGVLKKIRSKQKKRTEQLDLVMHLVDFDPTVM